MTAPQPDSEPQATPETPQPDIQGPDIQGPGGAALARQLEALGGQLVWRRTFL